MKITNILQSFKVDLFAKKRINRSDAADKIPPPADKVQISSKARSLLRAEKDIAIGRLALQNVPDARENRIAEVKAKLQQGEYSKPGFARELADRLSGDSTIQKIIKPRTGRLQKSASSIITPDREQVIQQVRNKIASGYYDKPDIRSDTADRILNIFGI